MVRSWLSKSTVVGLIYAYLANAATPSMVKQAQLRIPNIEAPNRPLISPNGTSLPPITTVYEFDQIIDHENTKLGTFKQRYWMNWEFYEKSGPIVLMTPGEASGDGMSGYLTNKSMLGMIAQEQKGAIVLLEHRFFGTSNPYDNLTSQSLEVLTIQQAIEDLVYFAQNVNLPMPGGDQVKPHQVPWVLVGGSYAGALTAWTMENKPGIFHAAYASSAVVEAITDFYALFTPIREHMPKNCSADVERVVAYLDNLHLTHNQKGIQDLQNAFGLEKLAHIDDFAGALQDNLFDYQLLDYASGPEAMFYQFCDALEVKDGVHAPAAGWGLQHAIQAWGNFWNTTYYKNVCGTLDPESCLGTYDASQTFYTDVSVGNVWRAWFWMMCNELGFYQPGPPLGQPAIVSRIVQPVYWERQCALMFPQKFSKPPTPRVQATNKKYKGWNINVKRTFFATGVRDHWRDATLIADGLHKPNTTSQPIYRGNGFHCSDLDTENGLADPTVLQVQKAGLAYMKTWLAQFIPAA
ncbi:peptidase S28 [Hygrophoropsis aurantiaca]|uniref:Peptidase S28 n=1 Tax=Hygrophoropsis aurantiaca TaxID=72124 RepID=A0ACB8ATM5_9AGAM|nr:peptidase S28 [Hygrophoropsis aurantiaca]